MIESTWVARTSDGWLDGPSKSVSVGRRFRDSCRLLGRCCDSCKLLGRCCDSLKLVGNSLDISIPRPGRPINITKSLKLSMDVKIHWI